MSALLLTGARIVPGLGGPGRARDEGGSGSPAGDELAADAVGVDVRIRDGRIEAVGAALAPSPGDEVVDIDGRWLMPGMWDAHTHMDQWALARQRLDVSSARSAAEAARLVTDRLRVHPPPAGAPLVGYGFRDGLWPDEPTAALLDDALAAAGIDPDVAVVVVSGDLHCGWANTAGLAWLGAPGHPTGLLRESEWLSRLGALDDVPAGALDAWVAEAARAAAARGVVGVVDFELADNLATWQRRASAGAAPVRVAAGIWPEYLDRAAAWDLRTGDAVAGTGGLVCAGPLKVIVDGSLNTRTALCFDPYPGTDDVGVLSVPEPELAVLLAHARRRGIDAAVHAIGDRAVALVIDAFEATGARGGIEHAQLVRPADAARMAALGLVASVQPEHAMDDRDVADRHWAGLTANAFAYGTLWRAGVRLTLGSDAPVAPLDPWLAIAAAVGRARDGREPWHPEQRIPLQVALAASVRSRVEPGQVADLAVLDADPEALPWAPTPPGARQAGHSLRSMPVAGTLLAGRWTHAVGLEVGS